MIKQQISYECFKRYIVRTPLLRFTELNKVLDSDELSTADLKNLLDKENVNESVFLASQDLYDELHKAKDKASFTNKLKLSFLKYFIRMSTRGTPFGLFGAVSVGSFNSLVSQSESFDYRLSKYSELDMEFLCVLVERLMSDIDIIKRFKLYTNNSLYRLDDSFRFIQFDTINFKRLYYNTNIEYSEYLSDIINRAKEGISFEELIQLLIGYGFKKKDAQEFIVELHKNQVLVSEIEPSVIGTHYSYILYDKLKELAPHNFYTGILKELLDMMREADSNDNYCLENYQQVYQRVSELELGKNIKNIINVTSFRNSLRINLNCNIQKSLLNGLYALNALSIYSESSSLRKFKQHFYTRYGDNKVPLLHVLDNDLSIGYNWVQGTGEVSDLFDGLILPRNNQTNEIKLNSVEKFLLKKCMENMHNSRHEIILADHDLNCFDTSMERLPITLAAKVNIIDTELVVIKSADGPSATRLIGRFGNFNDEIKTMINDLSSIEKEHDSNREFVEIAHLPYGKIGNIINRPSTLKYEVPLLVQSRKKTNAQINISDIEVSIRNNQVRLFSKSLNRYIKPHLGCAHNWSFNSIPIYRFLCDLQNEGIKDNVSFSWGAVSQLCEFLPRVKYKDAILSLATWIVQTKDISNIINSNKDEVLEAINAFRKQKKIPIEVILSEGDNELFLNLENINCVELLISIVKSKTEFKLVEFISQSKVNGEGSMYLKEFVFSLNRVKSQNE